MMFLSVGSQLPFDRLIECIDKWLVHNSVEVFAQIGKSNYSPKYMKWVDFMEPREYDKYFREAKVIIAHAGTGVIMNALEQQKPIIVMPRQEKFREHRNDHQVATVNKFRETLGVYVASDCREMERLLANIDVLQVGEKIEPYASGQIITTIQNFINDSNR